VGGGGLLGDLGRLCDMIERGWMELAYPELRRLPPAPGALSMVGDPAVDELNPLWCFWEL